MKKITLVFSLMCFLMFKPHWLNGLLLYSGDDSQYFAYSTSIAFGTYPDLSREFVQEAHIAPLHRAGPGLLASPFVSLFSIIDRAENAPIVKKRELATIRTSWSLFGFFVATVAFGWFSCLFAYRTVRLFYSEQIAERAVTLLYVFQILPVYVCVRPIFSHIYELFFQTVAVYFLAKMLRDRKFEPVATPPLAWVVVINVFAMLCRQTASVYAIMWTSIYFIIGSHSIDPRKNARGYFKAAKALIATFAFYTVIKHFPEWATSNSYSFDTAAYESSGFLYQFESPLFYFERLFDLLFGLDWGLIFTAPFFLIGLLFLLFSKVQDSISRKLWLWATLPLLVNMYIVFIWKGQGSWFGYRYFLFAAIPVMLIPFSQWLSTLDRKMLFIVAGICLLPVFSNLWFANAEDTTLMIVKNKYGDTLWNNPSYQVRVWKHVLSKDFFKPFVAGGASYMVSLAAHLGGFHDKLPAKFQERYSIVSVAMIVKTFLFWVTPWILYGIYRVTTVVKTAKPGLDPKNTNMRIV